MRQNGGTGGVLASRVADGTGVLALVLWSRLGDEESAATSALIHCHLVSEYKQTPKHTQRLKTMLFVF